MKIDKSRWIQEITLRTEARLNEILAAMELANDSLVNDTKSSMGDKYETSREMAQQELTRLQQQLKQVENDLATLQLLPTESNNIVAMGSLVVTNQFNYLISISIGQVKFEEEVLMVISKESPIGKLLLGKSRGDQITFNGNEINIIDLL
ncbi:hypothetical protein GCM10022216_16570 [Sphingobacterium kyonggiense]|uniref:Transcription elongation GreA/GreB family factor n=1 Tax=Sphingobacterium kyonggiense TaxID=714075 RepID=A0ABP7YNU1_9SPHI